uniref:Uncharacterized protein n=1 Tax=Amphimedon queenslandica TaxID=400682 RepID=A0A1X7VV68_AMPQE
MLQMILSFFLHQLVVLLLFGFKSRRHFRLKLPLHVTSLLLLSCQRLLRREKGFLKRR